MRSDSSDHYRIRSASGPHKLIQKLYKDDDIYVPTVVDIIIHHRLNRYTSYRKLPKSDAAGTVLITALMFDHRTEYEPLISCDCHHFED
jgi:hypothetical protein